MFRCFVVNHQVPGVPLPTADASGYALRQRSGHNESYSTFEAIIRALEIMEGPEAVDPLKTVFNRFVSRHLVSRGKLHPRQVL